ncbi:hypothetical protein VNI00_018100 [Paramarasmius palmivorus]|uniref:Uncharacterized protein n=1 Tax=Paramarasmius palmivorus TaxID=297713 RepID=A0AAW0B1B9_9AGAR
MPKSPSDNSGKKTRRNWLKIPDANPHIPQFTPVPPEYCFQPLNGRDHTRNLSFSHNPFSVSSHASGSAQLPIRQPDFNLHNILSSHTPSSSANTLPTPESTPESSPTHANISLDPPFPLQDAPDLPNPQDMRQRLEELHQNVPEHSEQFSRPKKTKEERDLNELKRELVAVDECLRFIQEKMGYSRFLDRVLWTPSTRCGSEDYRTAYHKQCVQHHLQGRDDFKPIHYIRKLYSHPYSNPSYRSQHLDEREKAFSLTVDPASLHYARIQISAFSAQLCARRASREVGILTRDDPDHPDDPPARMAATGTHAIKSEDLKNFTPLNSMELIKRRAPFTHAFVEHLITSGIVPIEGMNT